MAAVIARVFDFGGPRPSTNPTHHPPSGAYWGNATLLALGTPEADGSLVVDPRQVYDATVVIEEITQAAARNAGIELPRRFPLRPTTYFGIVDMRTLEPVEVRSIADLGYLAIANGTSWDVTTDVQKIVNTRLLARAAGTPEYVPDAGFWPLSAQTMRIVVPPMPEYPRPTETALTRPETFNAAPIDATLGQMKYFETTGVDPATGRLPNGQTLGEFGEALLNEPILPERVGELPSVERIAALDRRYSDAQFYKPDGPVVGYHLNILSSDVEMVIETGYSDRFAVRTEGNVTLSAPVFGIAQSNATLRLRATGDRQSRLIISVPEQCSVTLGTERNATLIGSYFGVDVRPTATARIVVDSAETVRAELTDAAKVSVRHVDEFDVQFVHCQPTATMTIGDQSFWYVSCDDEKYLVGMVNETGARVTECDPGLASSLTIPRGQTNAPTAPEMTR